MKKLISLFALIILASTGLLAQNITFKASAPASVAVNEQFKVIYSVESSSDINAKELRVPDAQGLNQLYGPSTGSRVFSSNYNGQSSTTFSKTFTYIYLASETGTYTIPAATIKVNDKTYESKAVTVKVVTADQALPGRSNSSSQRNNNQTRTSSTPAISNNDLFIRTHVSKRSPYEGEGLIITFKLYYRQQGINLTNFQAPDLSGFLTQEIDLSADNSRKVEEYDGRQYYTAVLRQYVAFPIKAGSTSISTGKCDVEIHQEVINQNRNSFFDPPYIVETTKKTLTSPSVEVNVKALPAGKPVSFSGAVGDFSMTSSINTQELKTDDVLSIKLNINGSGNIKFLKNPSITFPNDFDDLDTKVSESIRVNTAGVSGSKSIEYMAIPRYAGIFTIPKVEFSYFDLKSQTYKTLSSESYTIKVEQGTGTGGNAMIVNGTSKEDVKYLGKDIRHIKTGNYAFQTGEYFWGTIGYWLFYIIPAVGFIIFFIINRKRAAENANIALSRTKKANKVATKRLKIANKHLKEHQKEAFYDEISKAVWGYLGDKLNMPVASLTKDNVELELQNKHVDQELINQFLNILDTAEFARFAPSDGHQAMDDLYNLTVAAIDKMENVIKK
jgi:hypothetical protein